LDLPGDAHKPDCFAFRKNGPETEAVSRAAETVVFLGDPEKAIVSHSPETDAASLPEDEFYFASLNLFYAPFRIQF
jgi:hypothetical protein